MAGIACVWANIPEGREEWYENVHLPSLNPHNAKHALHCEVTASGMENEPVGRLDAPWPYMTVWEIKSVDQANKDMYDAQYHPPNADLQASLKGLLLDLRSYREIKSWKQDDWSGDGGDIEYVASVAAMEWSVPADKEEEVMKYYREVVGPTISSSPDVLRFRLFEVDNATTMQGGKFETKDKKELHRYFTLVELESEQWPWDVVVDLAEDKEWKDYFESQQVVKWQLSHYLMKRAYGVPESKASASS